MTFMLFSSVTILLAYLLYGHISKRKTWAYYMIAMAGIMSAFFLLGVALIDDKSVVWPIWSIHSIGMGLFAIFLFQEIIRPPAK